MHNIDVFYLNDLEVIRAINYLMQFIIIIIRVYFFVKYQRNTGITSNDSVEDLFYVFDYTNWQVL